MTDGNVTGVEQPSSERAAIFARLGRKRRKQIPIVLQLNIVECGAAALAMALGYHGKHVPLHHVREQIGVDRDGATALSLLTAARGYGMSARGARLDIDDLAHLAEASILHWDFNHFVVFERFLGDAIVVIDPAVGRRRVSIEQVRKSFTGVALLLEPNETFERQRAAAAPSWSYVRAALRDGAPWARIIVTSMIVQVCAIAVPLMTGMVVDRVVPRDDAHLLTVAGFGFASVVIFNFVASMARAHLLLQLRTQLDVKLALGFLTHLVRLPFDFFQKRSAGDILMRLGSNTAIRDILTTGTLSAMLDGALVCTYLALLLFASPLMGGVALGLGMLQLAAFWVCGKKRRELMAESLHVQARQANYQVEILAGIEALKSMGAEQRAVERWTDLFVDSQNVALERGRLSAALDSVMSSLRLAAPLLVLGTGATLVLNGELSLGMMLALNSLAIGFLMPLATLVGTAEQFELLGSYVQRLDDVFGHSLEQDAARVVPPPRLTGRIRLESVSFRYGERAPLAVRDVSVDIEPGQCIAIVGPSGCGKTTLASLLLALYKPTAGRIQYDGRDLAGLDVMRLRHQLGVVIQRPYVFGATVRQNIALADPGLSLEAVRRAAQLAQIDEEIMALPMGYETIVNGSTLSGGQRQRISIARALIREPSILLLDEATSSLDSITEARVREAIDTLGCTRIVLAHRLSTIRHADVILVMRDGTIVERGTHEALLALGGSYCELIAAQRDSS